MVDDIKPSVVQKPDMVILHAGTNDLRSEQTPSDIGNRTIKLARAVRGNGIEVAIFSLIRHSNHLSEKGKMVNNQLKEVCTAKN